MKLQAAFEENAPWSDVLVEACDPPRRLALSTTDQYGTWRLELLLSEAVGATELRLVQHLVTEEGLGEVGPGWEYYLDMLVSARDGSPRPDFARRLLPRDGELLRGPARPARRVSVWRRSPGRINHHTCHILIREGGSYDTAAESHLCRKS
ncbi:hypothetical protein [Nonomuraea sp. NPDC003754]